MSAKPGPLRPHEERPDYKRRDPNEPVTGDPGLGDSFLIVVEGEVTEKMYFEAIRTALQIHPVTVCVIHPSCTDAEGLVREAIEVRDSRNADRGRPSASYRQVRYDHVWVVFDTDVPARQSQLGSALDLARANNIHVGYSTPSVETWLLLHLRTRPGPLTTSDAAERAVSVAWGRQYNKTARLFPELWSTLRPNIAAAVHRCTEVREYHRQAATAFPPDPSTELDRLVLALNASVRPQLRIIR